MSNSSEVLAIIPARGGSKGIPGKNFYPISGKPLISYAIEAALESRCVNRVIVSTDDKKITEVSSAYGAETVQRPVEISGDDHQSEEALLHVIDHLAVSEKYIPEWLIFIQCTSPLILSEDIDEAYKIASTGKYDSVFSAYEEHFMGRWQYSKNSIVSPVNYKPDKRPMRQELPREFVENGAIYLMRIEHLKRTRTRFGEKCGISIMPLERSFQVDTLEDISLIEKIINGRYHNTDKNNVSDALLRQLAKLKLVIVDFDGTMTDNKVLVDQDGREQVVCNRSDGWGVRLLKNRGIKVVCLTSEQNSVVLRRCEKLEIECYNGVLEKGMKISEICERNGVVPEETAFIGNDINDIPALKMVGIPVAVQDAHRDAKMHSKIVLNRCGGEGVLQEFAELLIK
jgi:YrbI family 3-deoxy-D-manno-octulosonate 8-phosphate phosphatase